MKRNNGFIISGLIVFLNGYGSMPSIDDIEAGNINSSTGTIVVKQPNFSHQQIAEQIQLNGYKLPSNILIKHLDQLLTQDPIAHRELTQDLNPVRRRKTQKHPAVGHRVDDEKKDQEDDFNRLLTGDNLKKFISKTVNEELEAHEEKEKKEKCNRILIAAGSTACTALLGAGGNIIQWLITGK